MARILLVEDDHDAAALIARWLGGDGHDVELATTGEQGLERVAGEHWDGVLLDVVLPGVSGDEVARRLAAGPHPPPVLIVSIMDEDEFSSRVPVAAWLSKPFTRDGLRQAVAAAFGDAVRG